MITLQFSATAGLSSDAIKWFERGWCTHVDAVLPDGSLLGARSDAIGGKPPGVQIRPDHYEAWTSVERVSLNDQCLISGDLNAKWLAFLMAQVGKPYDEEAILAFAFGRDWRRPDSWFCSELHAAALEACGWFPQPLASVANQITPRDLLLIVSPWARP